MPTLLERQTPATIQATNQRLLDPIPSRSEKRNPPLPKIHMQHEPSKGHFRGSPPKRRPRNQRKGTQRKTAKPESYRKSPAERPIVRHLDDVREKLVTLVAENAKPEARRASLFIHTTKNTISTTSQPSPTIQMFVRPTTPPRRSPTKRTGRNRKAENGEGVK